MFASPSEYYSIQDFLATHWNKEKCNVLYHIAAQEEAAHRRRKEQACSFLPWCLLNSRHFRARNYVLEDNDRHCALEVWMNDDASTTKYIKDNCWSCSSLRIISQIKQQRYYISTPRLNSARVAMTDLWKRLQQSCVYECRSEETVCWWTRRTVKLG